MKKIIIEKVTACPFEDYHENRTGYSYLVERTEITGEEEVNEEYNWFIYSDGTFESNDCVRYTDAPPEHGGGQGTFDKSLYDDFVSQMEHGDNSWQEKLQYNLEKSWYIEG